MSVSHWLPMDPPAEPVYFGLDRIAPATRFAVKPRESWLRLTLALFAEEWRRWVCIAFDHDIKPLGDGDRVYPHGLHASVCLRCGERW